ncbi:MAG: drrA [Gammaproteobacteria bacterium]|jgi:ABC-2 type transport system ATP-binding protein|nr:drrA [Gammaproteobacteria bacterium]
MLALTVKNLTKIYPNKLTALKGIHFSIAQGDFFGLLGPNGAGKSTTIGILSSLVKKTSGTVRVFEYDIDTDFEAAKACIGIVPQEINFNPFEKIMDILVNQAGYYGISRKIAIPRAELYLKEMGLWESREKRVSQLSGGMKRRLMIARALVNEPKLLILDEPTAGVDVELRHSLWKFLTDLNKQSTTIILTTHYLEEAEKLCKNVAIIDQGKIIKNASTNSLINDMAIHTVILKLATPIHSLMKLGNYFCRLLDNLTIEVELLKNQSLNGLFDELSKQHIQINSIHNKTNRLEELFIRLISENKASSL